MSRVVFFSITARLRRSIFDLLDSIVVMSVSLISIALYICCSTSSRDNNHNASSVRSFSIIVHSSIEMIGEMLSCFCRSAIWLFWNQIIVFV